MKLTENCKKFSLLFLCTISILIIGLIFKYNYNDKINASAPRVELDKFVEVGILGEDGQLIDNGSNLTDKKNNIASNKLYHTLSMNQKDDVLKEYILIILEDFKQINFSINNVSYNKYIFTLNKTDSINIDIKLNLSENSNELCYLILPKPTAVLNELESYEKLSLQNIFISRFKLNNSKIDLNYENTVDSIKTDLIPEIFISKNQDDFTSLFEVNENDDIYLTLGNPSSSGLDYAVILFKDWEQVNITETDLIKYVSIEPKSIITKKMLSPEQNKDTIMQFVAFPLPYKTDSSVHLSTMGFASDRFIIKNIQN